MPIAKISGLLTGKRVFEWIGEIIFSCPLQNLKALIKFFDQFSTNSNANIE